MITSLFTSPPTVSTTSFCSLSGNTAVSLLHVMSSQVISMSFSSHSHQVSSLRPLIMSLAWMSLQLASTPFLLDFDPLRFSNLVTNWSLSSFASATEFSFLV